MGQNAQTDRSPRGYITIDWMVLAMACIATLFLLGTLLRTSVEAGAVRGDGFQELSGRDALLAFQDFSFDATGWDPSDTSDRLPGLGPVLGPFSTEPVQRSFAMPADAASTQMTFDLHMVGDWSTQGVFHVSLGVDEVLTVELPGQEEAQEIALQVTESDRFTVAVQSTFVTPRAGEASLPGANNNFVTLRVRLSVVDPDETLTLRLHAEAEGDARWTLDNLTVVATSGDGMARR